VAFSKSICYLFVAYSTYKDISELTSLILPTLLNAERQAGKL